MPSINYIIHSDSGQYIFVPEGKDICVYWDTLSEILVRPSDQLGQTILLFQ